MRSPWRFMLFGGVLLVAAGCANSEEWSTWYSHSSHFASGAHAGFSLRNSEGSQPKVTRRDVALARDQSWWGKPITVSQEQIIER